MSWLRPRHARPRRPRRFTLRLDELDARAVPAVVAVFSPGTGTLTVIGDGGNNSIAVGRDAVGRILVNGGAVPIVGGTPTVANTALIQLNGGDGNDRLALGAGLPGGQLFGGVGNDILTGGAAGDQLFGQNGDDVLFGQAGNDSLFGGTGNDVLTGGAGDDQAFGEGDDDRMVWNPGDGTDLNEGGDGTDTAEVNGDNTAEAFAVTANGTRVRFDRRTPAPFSLDVGTTENLVLNANGGNDSVTAGNGLATLIRLTANGGAGNDVLTGGDGNDFLFGGDGSDLVTGGRGADVALLGAGNDTFVWNPGDGSDTVEGQAGTDALLFNGANIAEKIDLSANGGRVRFTRDIATIFMDLDNVEAVTFNALGGTDTVTVNDLTGTDVTRVNVHLAAAGGGGDGAIDRVVVNGTARNDAVAVTGSSAAYFVRGLRALVAVDGSEAALDQLIVNALGGNDTVSGAALPAGVVGLVIDGGPGNDRLVGSPGADLLIGGDGTDVVDGNGGNDGAQLGAGNDTFVWNPGDGSDIIEGEDGSDTLRFNGSSANEAITVSSNGSRLVVLRDVGGVLLDVGTVERVDVNALGGADTVAVNDQSTTAADLVIIDLGADGLADSVVVNGTNLDDSIGVSGRAGGGVFVAAPGARVDVTRADALRDRLTVNLLDGTDQANASGLPVGVIRLTLNGGAGNDLLIGSRGRDDFVGGRDTDVALMGAGDDTFTWNPGDGSDTVEGQAGTDTLLFNGANIAEKIDLSANGGRLRFTRDIATIVMDVNDTEVVTFNALGGADAVTVNDLTGTDVRQVNLNLAALGGGGDGAADTVTVNGTAGRDVVAVAGGAGGVAVAGLAARVRITGSEGANDALIVSALGGNDAVNASGLAAGFIRLTADGGEGNDQLVGSAGDDSLVGGAGNDVLIGGPGVDGLNAAPGTDVTRQ